jgi:hypothetical protein
MRLDVRLHPLDRLTERGLTVHQQDAGARAYSSSAASAAEFFPPTMTTRCR